MFRDLFWSSPQTSFVVQPLTVLIGESLRGRFRLPDIRFLPLLPWGYLQYRLCGDYRSGLGGGSRGMQGFPDHLVTTGPYAYTRNPMYLGHLIFSLGLVLAFRSPIAAVFALSRVVYFARRVQRDEERLTGRFGDEYRAYKSRVKRWVPGVF